MSPTAEQTKLLSIYLEDHVAGATAGSQRAARLADAEADTKDAHVLATFAAVNPKYSNTSLAGADSP